MQQCRVENLVAYLLKKIRNLEIFQKKLGQWQD
jgi:hypothetical protein